MMWNGGFGMGGAGGVIWIVVLLAVLALIVAGIVLLVRRQVPRQTAHCRSSKSATPAGISTRRSSSSARRI
jgi:hypothetical protein